jgi:hypothetical protein
MFGTADHALFAALSNGTGHGVANLTTCWPAYKNRLIRKTQRSYWDLLRRLSLHELRVLLFVTAALQIMTSVSFYWKMVRNVKVIIKCSSVTSLPW